MTCALYNYQPPTPNYQKNSQRPTPNSQRNSQRQTPNSQLPTPNEDLGVLGGWEMTPIQREWCLCIHARSTRPHEVLLGHSGREGHELPARIGRSYRPSWSERIGQVDDCRDSGGAVGAVRRPGAPRRRGRVTRSARLQGEGWVRSGRVGSLHVSDRARVPFAGGQSAGHSSADAERAATAFSGFSTCKTTAKPRCRLTRRACGRRF